MPHVVTVKQGYRTRSVRHTRFEDAGNCPVDGLTAALNIARQIGIGHIQPVAGIQIVAPLRHGKRDDPSLRVRPFGNQRLQIRLPRDQRLNRGDLFIVSLAFRADGLQYISPLLRGQRLHHMFSIVAYVARSDVPARIAAGNQAVQIPRLMRTMKRPQSNM